MNIVGSDCGSDISGACRKLLTWTLPVAFFLMPWAKPNWTEFFLGISLVLLIGTGQWRSLPSMIMKNSYALWFVGLFFLYVISLLYSQAMWSTTLPPEFKEMARSMALQEAMKNIRFVFFLLLIPYFIDPQQKEKFLRAFLLGAIFSCFFAVVAVVWNQWTCFVFSSAWVKFIGKILPVYTSLEGCLRPNTVDYPMLNHTLSSTFDAFSAFFCLHRIVGRSESKKFFYWFSFLIVMIHLFLLNQSRTGELIFLVLLFLLVIQKKQWSVFIAVLAFFAGLGVLWHLHGHFYGGVQRAKNDLVLYHKENDPNSSVGTRILQARNAFNLWLEKPWFGYGAGGYGVAYYQKAQTYVGAKNPWIFSNGEVTNSPRDIFRQNQFLSEMDNLGLPGLFILLGWLCSLLYYARRLSPENRYIVQGFVITFILGNFSEQMLYWGISADFFGVMSILLLAYNPKAEIKDAVPTN